MWVNCVYKICKCSSDGAKEMVVIAFGFRDLCG
jgi:hypothetical protein